MTVNRAAAEWVHDQQHTHYLAHTKLHRDSSEDEVEQICEHLVRRMDGTCFNCGKQVEQPRASWEPRLLDEARAAITGARNGDYGDPWDNHGNTAEVWQWWLKCRFGIDVPLIDLDVCMMNDLQKSSRLANSIEHRDSWVDKAGYSGNAGACLDHKNDGDE